MRYFLLGVLTLAACSKSRSGADSVKTVRHEGLCFVMYERTKTGVSMVQVKCDELVPLSEDAQQ